jgi:hypothetical protein
LVPSWKKHSVHPKKEALVGLALGPAKGAALGALALTWPISRKEGLNPSKLISRQEKIQVTANCRNANDRVCFYCSTCASTHILTLLGIDVSKKETFCIP